MSARADRSAASADAASAGSRAPAGPSASGDRAASPITDFAALVATLDARRVPLSRRLEQVARHLLDHPEDAAMYNAVQLARAAGVQPSTITRFAKTLGFAGFAELQAVFRERLVGPRMDYAERLKALSRTDGLDALDLDRPGDVFDAFAGAAMNALVRLREEIDAGRLERFVALLAAADTVHVAAARGAYGVGAYCFYGLARVGHRARLMDNVGAMRAEQLLGVGPGDAVLALSFDDYTPETVEIARAAREADRTLLTITDNELSPIAAIADETLFVKEARLGHFRSQVPAMVLCQSIIASVGGAGARADARGVTR